MTAHCILCNTSITPRTAVGKNREFCCAGCEKVYDVLTRLDDDAKAAYVETARKLGLIPSNNIEETEGVTPQAARSASVPEFNRTERLTVTGLVCPSCGWVAGEVLACHDGVNKADINYFTGTAEVTYDMTRTSLDDMDDLLRPLGYRIGPLEHQRGGTASRRQTFDFVVVAILAMNVMSLSILRYIHTLGYLADLPGYLAYIEGVLVLPILAIGWVPAVRRATAAAIHHRLTMDMLIAIGVAAAAMLSYLSLFSGRHDMYFETCAGLVAIALLSRMIEARLRDRAFAELGTLMKMPVIHVRRWMDGEDTYVGTDDIQIGDRIRFLVGELVPFDGEVVEQPVVVSEAVLTGEPTPLTKAPGDRITAGSKVVEGELHLHVTRRFDDTRLQQITQSIGETLAKQEGHLRQADRIASWFIPLVLLISVGAFVIRGFLYGWTHALSSEGWFPSVAVLAVACPCAFSLAGISAVTTATGALLKKGFLVKELAGLESLSSIDQVVFDKTGTVTRGEMHVTGLFWKTDADSSMLSKIWAAEQHCGHPVASAIRAHLLDLGVSPSKMPDDIEDIPGQGRIARFGTRSLVIGAAPLFDAPVVPDETTPAHSVVWFGWDRTAVGAFLLTDQVRTEARATVRALKTLGMSVALLSGDRREVTRAVGDDIDINDIQGDASIETKIQRVKQLIQTGRRVAFIGDGTNDALAMKAADLSVALAKSTDEALSASDIVVLRGDLSNLNTLFLDGRRLASIITQNYIWAFAFNTIFIPVAAAGKLVPLIAMLLMLVSSIAVLLNSTRLKHEHRRD